MSRIKSSVRPSLVLFLITLCLLLGACSNKDKGYEHNDGKSNIGEELLLQMQGEKNKPKEYSAEVFRGDFTKSLNAKAYLVYTKNTQITFKTKSLTTIFEEYLLIENQSVKKGDAVAKIRYEGNPVHYEELKIQLKQLEKQSEVDLDQKKEQIKNIEMQLNQTTDRIQRIRLQYQLEIAKTGYVTYEKEVKESMKLLQEELQDYSLSGTTDYILAPCDGLAAKPEYIKKEDVLWNEQPIVTIYDPESAILVFEDLNSQLRYGMKVSVEVTKQNENQTLSGWVVSGENLITKDRRAGYVYVKVDDFDSRNYLDAKFKVTAMLYDIKDVLLVEDSAVTIENSKTYITCLENGKKKKVYFVSGGMNTTYHWVLEGLEEGMVALR